MATTAVAMIATPLVVRGRRSGLAVAVVGGLAGWAGAAAARRWGPARAAAAVGAVATATAVVEKVGTTTGVPFGRYRYTPALQPQVAGVPAVVPLAWFALGLPARESARALLGPAARPVPRAVTASALLTAWDLFLDPQMTAEGYWRWSTPGGYRGIPLRNYLGWFVTGLGVMAILDAVLPGEGAPDASLVGEYSWMAVMSTLGFVAFFRDPLVAAVGGVAMVPAALAAVRGAWSWPTS